MMILDVEKLLEDEVALLDFYQKTTEIFENKKDVQSMAFVADALCLRKTGSDSESIIEKEKLFLAHIIEIADFWLLSKEFFMKLDRIIDHSENLPMIETNEEFYEKSPRQSEETTFEDG